MSTAEDVLKEAILLNPTEKAMLVDHLISSLDKPDTELDKLWANEAESRLDAYNQGKIKAVSLDEVLSKYK
jgi:putative addiction module component (TIGR02574 family)